MRTTIDVDKDLLQEAMKLANVKTKKKAISLALSEFVRTKRLERLASRVGTFELSLTRDDLERMRR
ncbi:MAG: type II toxin-antitoxin system VapB family antitoxin [Armatimonadota bacterium]|nr:type II toxin-antitoxin system VapB family antitoxin [Armatimonadota bacterium]MDR5704161.1 type II toxin-antitoxin system VapB family antitoxin [Armatimonadota bacterium]